MKILLVVLAAFALAGFDFGCEKKETKPVEVENPNKAHCNALSDEVACNADALCVWNPNDPAQGKPAVCKPKRV